MIDIVPDKKKIVRSLQELEFDYSQGNISRKAYISQKNGLNEQLETLDTADRIKRLQGKGQVEKPLEYWTEKEEEKKKQEEREVLLQRYVSSPQPPGKLSSLSSGRWKTMLAIFLVVAFFVGTGFGVLIMQSPSESSGASLVANESAFPVENTTNLTDTNTSSSNTNVTKTTTKKNTTTVKPTTPTTPTTNTTG
ncbi:MAG: hypothetical protein ABFC91_06565 [Methanobacteriaceae archaeon]